MKSKNAVNHYPLWVALTRSHYYLQKLRNEQLKKIGLSMTQSTVLAIVHRSKLFGVDATPAEISKNLLKAPSTTTELISRMVDQGMVKKVQDLERRNMVRIELTELGKSLYEKSINVDYFSKIFSKLEPKRRKRLITDLSFLIDSYFLHKK